MEDFAVGFGAAAVFEHSDLDALWVVVLEALRELDFSVDGVGAGDAAAQESDDDGDVSGAGRSEAQEVEKKDGKCNAHPVAFLFYSGGRVDDGLEGHAIRSRLRDVAGFELLGNDGG